MAGLIDYVVGHQVLMDRFQNLIQSQKWPSSMILVGPSGIGKKKMIMALLQQMLCESDRKPCGACGSCLRLAKGHHENVLHVKPAADAAVPQIKVDAIRGLLDSLSLASDRERYVVIEDAHRMNIQASNALLKSLEEPSKDVFFILIGDDLEAFLPTIKSRCQIFRFSALTDLDLRQIRPLKPDWVYKCARGRVDRLDALVSEEGLEKREEALSLFEFFCVDPQFLFEKTWRDIFKEKQKAQFVVNQWSQVARDVLFLKTGRQDEILNVDQMERLKQMAQKSKENWAFMSQKLIELEQGLLANQDATLLVENLWVNYAKMD